MPCMLLMLLTVLFVVICGHRLDSYLHKPLMDIISAEHSDSHTPAAAHLSNRHFDEEQSADSGALSLPQHQQQRYYGRRNDLLQSLYTSSDCASCETQLLRRDNMDMDSKRFSALLAPLSAHNVNENTEALSEVRSAGMDKNTQMQLGDAAMPAAHNDWQFGNVNSIVSSLPVAYYTDFYEDLMVDSGKEDVKRAGPAPAIGCDCKIKNDLLDLGQQHFPRYLLNAVCQTDQSPNEYPQKCWRGSHCKPLEYKVKVLTFRTIVDHAQKDPALAWLPDDLRQLWKFKTVTVAAGCFCSY